MTDRELDALVAENIMGWHNENYPSALPWTAPAGRCYAFTEIPHYRTDIAAAWEVVEAVYKKTGSWILVAPSLDRYVAYEQTGCADPDFGAFCEYADSAPRAICLAALKSVGAEVPA